MLLKKYSAHISYLSAILCKLLGKEPLSVQDINSGRNISQFNVEGVYVISTPDDSEFVYVGRTQRKTVAGRIKDHHCLNTNSDLKGMLSILKNYPQDIDNYLVRCIEIRDPRERTLFEHFLISILQPRFNK